MKFKDHAALTHQTNRLQAASMAAAMCDASMKEQQQIFDYAGQRFIGPDAMLLKHALLTALLSLADEATDALKKGGIEFEEPVNLKPIAGEVRRAIAQARRGNAKKKAA